MSPARGCGRCRNGLVRVLDFDGEDTSVDVCPCQYLPQPSTGGLGPRERRGQTWQKRAHCRLENGHDPDLWWPDAKGGEDVTYALSLCSSCPVTDECLSYAVEHGEKLGIWGGLMPEQRTKLRKGVNSNADSLAH